MLVCVVSHVSRSLARVSTTHRLSFFKEADELVRARHTGV